MLATAEASEPRAHRIPDTSDMPATIVYYIYITADTRRPT